MTQTSSRMICFKCAEKRGLVNEFRASNHRVFCGMGSTCDFCGNDTGGSVIKWPILTAFEPKRQHPKPQK